MKKLLFSTVLLFFVTFVIGQSYAVHDFIKSYSGGEQVTTVYISPAMLNMMTTEAKEANVTGDDFKELVSNFKGMSLMVTEKTPSLYLSKFKDQVKLDDYDELMLVNSEGEFVQMVAKMNGDNMIEEFVMIVSSQEEFVLLNFRGLFTLNSLQTLGNMFDMDIDID